MLNILVKGNQNISLKSVFKITVFYAKFKTNNNLEIIFSKKVQHFLNIIHIFFKLELLFQILDSGKLINIS